MDTELYLSGFAAHLQSEALPNALPKTQNSPQKPAYGLYAEQINGSAFTCARAENLATWCYRIHPSVVHGEFKLFTDIQDSHDDNEMIASPMQLRWQAHPEGVKSGTFIEGLSPIARHVGAAVYVYSCNQSMGNTFFYNADAQLLIIPQQGKIQLHTEFGLLVIEPQEIAVIPRGVKFQVQVKDSEHTRGYICENFGSPFVLPNLGLIGANGLAHPRHFLYPKAAYVDKAGDFKLVCRYQGKFWQAPLTHSPLDVVAWHGNYLPYKYDLCLFNTLNTVSFDHPDPSIFTVLTSASAYPGIANIDFVIFPPRWTVAENTFRLPYYHRNVMSEFMGVICGQYDAKAQGFEPGGYSLHNCMSAHGPDQQSMEHARKQTLSPERYEQNMAFMLESHNPWQVTRSAYDSPLRDKDYNQCWQDIKRNFISG